MFCNNKRNVFTGTSPFHSLQFPFTNQNVGRRGPQNTDHAMLKRTQSECMWPQRFKRTMVIQDTLKN